jgi:hypothetical protein
MDEVSVRHQILPHGSRVNDITRLKPSTSGHHRRADGNRPLANGLIFNDLATLALDRTRDTSPHPQMIIGCVDDGVDGTCGDVPLHYFKGGRAYVCDHQPLLHGT